MFLRPRGDDTLIQHSQVVYHVDKKIKRFIKKSLLSLVLYCYVHKSLHKSGWLCWAICKPYGNAIS